VDSEIYRIPANYTDAGRVMGLFEIRNVIEAVALGLPILFLCARFLPFSPATKIVVTMILFVPAAGFALIGIGGDSLTRYVKAWWLWRGKRRILLHRGEVL
jgi:hypothetical protein